MRIGVVSDTHNHLRNVRRIVELFNAAVGHNPHFLREDLLGAHVLDLPSLEVEWLRF
jgi:hypothetical protein